MKHILIETVQNIAAKVQPLIGGGIDVQKSIDNIAGKEIYQMLRRCNEKNCEIETLSIEGERDGVEVSFLYENTKKSEKYYLLSDPIEGTLSASRGGSRCVSVLALGKKEREYLKIPDELSCFYSASNTDEKFVELIWKIIEGEEIVSLEQYREDIIGTLRRQESEEFWKRIFFEGRLELIQGEKSFYYPNAICENVFFAGDSSILLFFECEHFCGRTGVAEARIEAQLWKYWKGLIVSGKRIKEYMGGMLGYLRDYMRSIREKNFCMENFFEAREVRALKQLGWTSEKVMSIFGPQQFSPTLEIAIIGSLTGTYDSVFSEHSNNNLSPIKIDKENQKFHMEYLLCEGGEIRVLESTFSFAIVEEK